MPSRLAPLLLLLAAGGLAAAEPPPADPASYAIPELGFTITPPRIPDPPDASPRQLAIFFLPPSDGFAANVNVLWQPFEGGLDAYADASKRDFEQLGVEELRSEIVAGVLLLEYTGRMPKQEPMHWYARAQPVAGGIILATGTTLEREWERQGPAIRASVDSAAATPPDAVR